MSMKFLVAPESMRAMVLMILFFPCRKMGKFIVLFVGEATSTRFIEWEEDVKVTSLFKNPKCHWWRFGQSLLHAPHSKWLKLPKCLTHSFQKF